MNATPDYASKINALLTQAADPAATPEEAKAFSAKAEALMIKWGISDAELDAKRRGQRKAAEKIVHDKFDLLGTEARNLLKIAVAIGPSFNVRVLQSSIYGSTMSKRVHVIGFESDVARMRVLFDSLAVQALNARAVWWSNTDRGQYPTGNDKFLAKRGFVEGFASEVGRRLRATKKSAEESVSQSTALVLVSRGEQVDGWMKDNMKVGSGRSQRSGVGGHSAGRDAGSKADLGTGRISGRKGIES